MKTPSEKFDCVILSDDNKWLSTLKDVTSKEVQDEIKELKEYGSLEDSSEVVIFKTVGTPTFQKV